MFISLRSFTLSETLIAITIIGVVVAITVPIIVNKYAHEQTIAKLKQNYSMLQQAFMAAQSEHGDILSWEDWEDSEKILSEYLAPHLRYKRLYPVSSNYYKMMCNDGKKNFYYWWLYPKTQVVSGPFMPGYTAAVELDNGICIGLTAMADRKQIIVDINGTQTNPNRFGEDTFMFYINNNGQVRPYGDTYTAQNINKYCEKGKQTGSGSMCAARIIKDGWKINY